MASLLEDTGRSDLVEHISRTQNYARVRELASQPALTEWLDDHGLTVAEAARIQPSYAALVHTEWRPTVSVIAGNYVGATKNVGAEAIEAAGLRAGILYEREGTDDGGRSRVGSVALELEYARAVVVRRGATNQFALVVQWEPTTNLGLGQWYVLGGPLASLDADDRPGSGFGAELGAGIGFRRSEVPLFLELAGQGLRQSGFDTVRLGIQLGAIW